MGLMKWLSRRSIETPAVPLTANNIGDILGGNSASSGVSVSPQSALGYPAVWRGVNIRASTIGRLPLNTLRRADNELDELHPAFYLLREQPNSEQSAKSFKTMLEAHAILSGGGFALITRNSFGQPTALIPLDPAHVIPFRENGRLGYSLLENGKMTVERPENIFHIKGLSWDGITGLGLIDVLRETIGLGLAAQKWQSIFFKNGAAPMTVIELPGSLRNKEAVERFRAMWGKRHRGIDNAHQPALLENGAQLKPFSISPNDAEMLATREFEIKQIASAIGIPSYLLQDNTRTSFASLEVENRTFLRDLQDPLTNWEDECKLKLLTPEERVERSHVIEFNRESIERPDLTTFVSALVMQVNNGLLSLDEARNKMNLPPLPEGKGADFRIPLNMGTVGGEDAEQVEEDEGMLLAAHNVLLHELTRMTERVSVAAKKNSHSPDKFMRWVDRLHDQHEKIAAANIAPGCLVLANAKKLPAEPLQGHILKSFFAILRESYLKAAECQPDQLQIRVADAATQIRSQLHTVTKEYDGKT